MKLQIEVEIAGCYESILCGEIVLGSSIVAVMVIARCPQVPGGPNGVLPCQAVVVPSLRPATRHARQYRRLKGHYSRRSNRNPRSLFCWTVETPNHAISTRTGTPPRMRSPGSLHVTRNSYQGLTQSTAREYLTYKKRIRVIFATATQILPP